MADFTIDDKTLLTSVDRAADLFLVADASASNAVKNTTVNNMLDLTSHPVGVDDSQTLTNKTMGVTNVVTLRDDRFTLQDSADVTKQVVFQLSGITTGTIRTFTFPDASTTFVGTTTTQTLTNKTLTSPTINTATISNPTLTVDTIAEHTGANGVTVDGVNLKDGLLNTANSVDSAAYVDGSIDPEHLVASTGTSWAWSDWTPTLTNLSGGTLTYAKYKQHGKTVHFRLKYTLGGAGVAGSVSFTLPVTAALSTANDIMLADVFLIDAGTAAYFGKLTYNGSATEALVYAQVASGTYLTTATLSSSVPHSWANTDVISIQGCYEAA